MKVEVQVSLVIVIEFSALSLTRMIQIWSFQQVGTKMWKYGILDNQVLVDQFMDLIFVVILLICMMDLFSLVPIKIPSSCNFGTLVQVNTLKISTGMKVYHLINHVSCMLLNSKRILVTLLFQEDQVQMKWKSLMLIICSNHVHRSEVWVEPASQLISAIVVTNLLAVEVTVLSESSMLLMKWIESIPSSYIIWDIDIGIVRNIKWFEEYYQIKNGFNFNFQY